MKNLLSTSFHLEPTEHIRNICILRLAVIVLTFLSVLWAIGVDAAFNSTTQILSILFLQLVVTTVSLVLNIKGKLASERHTFFQLLIDVFFISLYVYITGGISNPFVNYFLVPLSIASATLTPRFALTITGVTIILYTILLFFYQPFSFYEHQLNTTSPSYQPTNGTHDHSINLSNHKSDLTPHFVGMWINFLISALLITWFVLHMARAIRNQEKAINQQHEQQIYDEQVLSIATIAASAAHELGTPINSLRLLIDEYTKDNNLNDHQREDFNLMESQIMQCSASLKKLVDTAQQTQIGRRKVISCQQLIDRCLQEWQPLRPEVVVKKVFLKQPNEIAIFCDHSIAQALINLLNNAANSSPQQISIDLQYTAESISIIISDQGSGLPVHILEQYGKQPISDGEYNNSLGLGLFLSNASIRRHQGQLYLRNKYDNTIGTLVGAEAIIELPRWDEQNIEHN